MTLSGIRKAVEEQAFGGQCSRMLTTRFLWDLLGGYLGRHSKQKSWFGEHRLEMEAPF